MTRTVLLADMPETLGDILLHLLQAGAPARVVRGTAGTAGLAAAAAKVGATLVIVTRSHPTDLRDVDPLLALSEAVSVLALSQDGTHGCMHRLRLEATPYHDLTGEQLRAMLAGP